MAKGKKKRKIKGTSARPRLSVYRSNRLIFGQIIDDEKGKTLVAANEQEVTKEIKKPITKIEKARLVGEVLAKKALKKKVKKK